MGWPGLGSWIERRAARSPYDPALIAGDSRLTYGELAEQTRRVSQFLVRTGVGRGDRVVFHGRNDPLALTSLFATTALGAVWVPIHPARAEAEVRWILEDSGARVILRASPDVSLDEGLPVLDPGDLASLPPALDPLGALEPDPEDLAILAYTSGTTSAPKGVMLSHANVLWCTIQMLGACAFAPSDVTLGAVPFTRMGGLGVAVLPTLFAGGTVVVPEHADGSSTLAAIEEYGVTVVFANPDLLEEMVQRPTWADADLSCIRTGIVGGDLVPEPLLRLYLDRRVSLRHGYGLTEAAPVVSLLDEKDAFTRSRSVGKPLPFVEVRSTRPDGSTCEPEEVGHWWIRGPNVCSGYWRRPSVHDAEGWFPTGDVGSIDADGYLYLVGRASEAISIGGTIVYPSTIERALYGQEGVDDVGVVDVEGTIVAAVVPVEGVTLDEARILSLLRDELPGSVPAGVVRVEAIPRNVAEKILRDDLRSLLQLGAAESGSG